MRTIVTATNATFTVISLLFTLVACGASSQGTYAGARTVLRDVCDAVQQLPTQVPILTPSAAPKAAPSSTSTPKAAPSSAPATSAAPVAIVARR